MFVKQVETIRWQLFLNNSRIGKFREILDKPMYIHEHLVAQDASSFLFPRSNQQAAVSSREWRSTL